MSDKAEETFQDEVKAFQSWIDSSIQHDGSYHYALGDTLGANMLSEHRELWNELIDVGMDPIQAGRQALASVVSFAFQLGYDFHKATGVDLEKCECSRDKDLTTREDCPTRSPETDLGTGNYL